MANTLLSQYLFGVSISTTNYTLFSLLFQVLSAIKDCDVLPVADVDNAEALKHPALSAIKRHPAKRVALAVMGDFLFGSLGSIVTAQRGFYAFAGIIVLEAVVGAFHLVVDDPTHC